MTDDTPEVSQLRAALEQACADRDWAESACEAAETWFDSLGRHNANCIGEVACSCGLTRVRYQLADITEQMHSPSRAALDTPPNG